MQTTATISPSTEFRLWVEAQSGEKVSRCNQCGKCTAGCPTSYAMDWGPRRIMRGIQLGLKGEVLGSSGLWFCLFCHTCSVRCPLEIDIAKVIETLRLESVREKRPPRLREVEVLHRLFLRQIQGMGRVYELGLGGSYNLLSRHPLAKLRLLPKMLRRGKLPLLPRIKGASRARAIFARAKKAEKGEPLGAGRE